MEKPPGSYFINPGKFIIFLYPPLLITGCYYGFYFLSENWGNKQGLGTGMIIYWLLGCGIPVYLLISKWNRKLLLKIKKPAWWQVLLLLLPVLTAVYLVMDLQKTGNISWLIVFLTLPIAFIHAFCEEFFWRGLYFDHHPSNFFYAVMVPSIWYGVWYYAPLSILPAGIGNFYFILIMILSGLCWGTVTYYSRSVFWSIISHTLTGFAGWWLLYYSK